MTDSFQINFNKKGQFMLIILIYIHHSLIDINYVWYRILNYASLYFSKFQLKNKSSLNKVYNKK